MNRIARSINGEWSEAALGDLADFKNGINFTRGQKGEIGVPTVDVRNMYVRGVTVDLGNLYRVSKRIGADHLLKPNDLLFVRSSLKLEGIGWTSMFAGSTEPVSFCGFIIRARIRDDALVDPLYLTYFCRSDAARKGLIAGSGKVAITNISQDVLARLSVPLPPLSEQRKIAGVLGAVQRAIEQQQRLMALSAKLKKALLHQLFTRGLRGEPLRETEIGLVPQSWDVVTLGDIFHTQLGKMLSQKAHGGKAPKPYLRNKNVQWGRIDVTDLLEMDFNERELVKHRLLPGDLLVCEGGEPGRAALWDGEINECYYQKALHRLRPRDSRVTNQFLAHWLMFSLKVKNLYGVTGASSTIAHLPEVQLKALPIPLPTRSEQDEICFILEAADKKRRVIERKHAALTALFRTLLHQLMTAQIRVDHFSEESLYAGRATP